MTAIRKKHLITFPKEQLSVAGINYQHRVTGGKDDKTITVKFWDGKYDYHKDVTAFTQEAFVKMMMEKKNEKPLYPNSYMKLSSTDPKNAKLDNKEIAAALLQSNRFRFIFNEYEAKATSIDSERFRQRRRLYAS